MEMGPRAATFGKRGAGLRVVARSGERLTADRVIARNLMREIEFYLPLSFLFFDAADGTAGGLTALAGLAWTAHLPLLPLVQQGQDAGRRPARRHLGDQRAAQEADRRSARRRRRARAAIASPTRSSTSTACSSCRRWSGCCATARPKRSPPSPTRSATRSARSTSRRTARLRVPARLLRRDPRADGARPAVRQAPRRQVYE